MTEAEKKARHVIASNKYNAENVTQFKMNLNLKTDADIIAKFEDIEAKKEKKAGYIKSLIRKDLRENPI